MKVLFKLLCAITIITLLLLLPNHCPRVMNRFQREFAETMLKINFHDSSPANRDQIWFPVILLASQYPTGICSIGQSEFFICYVALLKWSKRRKSGPCNAAVLALYVNQEKLLCFQKILCVSAKNETLKQNSCKNGYAWWSLVYSTLED